MALSGMKRYSGGDNSTVSTDVANKRLQDLLAKAKRGSKKPEKAEETITENNDNISNNKKTESCADSVDFEIKGKVDLEKKRKKRKSAVECTPLHVTATSRWKRPQPSDVSDNSASIPKKKRCESESSMSTITLKKPKTNGETSSDSENEEEEKKTNSSEHNKSQKIAAKSNADDDSSDDSDDEPMAVDDAEHIEEEPKTSNDVVEEEQEIKPTKGDLKFFRPLGSNTKATTSKSQEVVPNWVSRGIKVSAKPKTSDDLAEETTILCKRLIKLLRANNITGLFPVQKQVIHWLLDNRAAALDLPVRDICVAAPTGSGKTLAFVLPIIQLLRKNFERAVRCLVLLPSAELAKQVHDVFTTYIEGTDLNVALITGLKNHLEEEKLLVAKGSSTADIVVATPAKLLEHLRNTKGFSLKRLEHLILDEADRMVDMIQHGLIHEIEDAVYDKDADSCRCSKLTAARYRVGALSNCIVDGHHTQLQKLLYSATLMSDPEKLQYLNLHQPRLFHAQKSREEINGDNEKSTSMQKAKYTLPDKLKEKMIICDIEQKPLLVWWMTAIEQKKGVLIFAKSREECKRLQMVMSQMGDCRVVDISGDMKKRQREKALRDFDNGEYDVLITTGVLSRGVDLENVKFVILYSIPQSTEEYVHMVGRTARANKKGKCISIVQESQKGQLTKLVRNISNSKIKTLEWNKEDLEPYYERYEQSLQKVKELVEESKN